MREYRFMVLFFQWGRRTLVRMEQFLADDLQYIPASRRKQEYTFNDKLEVIKPGVAFHANQGAR